LNIFQYLIYKRIEITESSRRTKTVTSSLVLLELSTPDHDQAIHPESKQASSDKHVAGTPSPWKEKNRNSYKVAVQL
jgi:hypothetical protein